MRESVAVRRLGTLIVLTVLLAAGAGPVFADHGTGTPTGAMDPRPIEVGHGFAHWRITGESQLAANPLFFGVGACERSFGPYTVPVGSRCVDTYNLTVSDPDTLVEVRLTWESNRTDLNLLVRNAEGDMYASVHGQVFVNKVCEHQVNPIGECVFLFAPNGTRWEYVSLGDDRLTPGEWTIEVHDQNNWRADHAAALAGGEPPTYTLDVWVYRLPDAEPTHDPAE